MRTEFVAEIRKPLGNNNLPKRHAPRLINQRLGTHPNFVALNQVALHTLVRWAFENRTSGMPSSREEDVRIWNIEISGTWHIEQANPGINVMPINHGLREKLVNSQANQTRELAECEFFGRRKLEAARMDNGHFMAASDKTIGILIDNSEAPGWAPCIAWEQEVNFHLGGYLL
jgi:hypothetical protein